MSSERWAPISIEELYDLVHSAEARMYGELQNLWQLIHIVPEKWAEPGYSDEGGGFWVVAICGEQVIWFNDIEDGFNISPYVRHGEIDGYFCNQDLLDHSVQRLLALTQYGGSLTGQAGPPQPLSP